MGSNYKMSYNVDIALVIDGTGSMDHFLETIKSNALRFADDVKMEMARKGKKVNQLRVRLVEFRDYKADDKNAMLTSDFFVLPDQEEGFKTVINHMIAFGGGDDPEDGLEALAYAIRSPWCTDGVLRRHVIVVWTDEATHELGFGSSSRYYPSGMARNLNELESWWENMEHRSKRLLLFAPDLPGWSSISNGWENVIHIPTRLEQGLQELEYMQIISTIVNSV